MKVRVGLKSIEYKVEGEPFVGKNQVLVKEHDDLTSKKSWHKEGYTIQKFLPNGTYLQFHEGMEDLFRKCLHRAGIPVNKDFRISDYHKLVGKDSELHARVIEQTKQLKWFDLPIHKANIEAVVSEIVAAPVTCRTPRDEDRVFRFRVLRPGEPDYNPLHRDAWQEEKKDSVNIYVPLTGSNRKSSLLLVPGSHLWPEHRMTRTKEGAIVNGVKVNSPGIINCEIPLKVIRPNPGLNRIMVYSPYLIHSESMNQNRGFTRVSFEMRFWRK